MNICASALLQKFRIWQQNAHKSKTAQSHVHNTAKPNNWDIIALQDPGSTVTGTHVAPSTGGLFTQKTSTWKATIMGAPFF